MLDIAGYLDRTAKPNGFAVIYVCAPIDKFLLLFFYSRLVD